VEYPPRPGIVCLNQSVGPTFMQLLNFLAASAGLVSLYTGSPVHGNDRVLVHRARAYDNRTVISRLRTWGCYLIQVAIGCLRVSGRPILFVTTNPPMLPWLAFLLRKIKGWPYLVLVLDVYPEALIRFGYAREHGFMTHAWHLANRLAYTRASALVTLGQHMAATIRRETGPGLGCETPLRVIPMWVDTERIRPIPKEENWFGREHGLLGKLVVLYSGNMGVTHDLDTVVRVARRLKGEDRIRFLFIGEGPQRPRLEEALASMGLHNVKVLPRVPEEVLPFSLSAGDVGIVSLDRGAEGISMPSKTPFMMAAGCAIVALSQGRNDLSVVVEHFGCGISVECGDENRLEAALRRFLNEPEFLHLCQNRAREAAESEFSATRCLGEYERVFSAASEKAKVVSAKTRGWYVRWGKRVLDMILCAPTLVALAPIMAILGLVVRKNLGRPVFFRQARPGLNGEPFTLFKLRTMTEARDAEGCLLPDNARLPRFGRFLRSTSLDELPELFNVLKGEMSIVGPRPLLIQYLDRYTPRQARRHEVRPGITGWAQVNGRNALTWEQKFAMDVWYVDHICLWLDLRIVAMTIWRILTRDGISQPGHATAEEFMGVAKEL
jgi:lipopolysaccharide/colanic/teichoic acid biosynthesis glycosyltransferase/glycosyltransferase involved in cell wall biosynthesis